MDVGLCLDCFCMSCRVRAHIDRNRSQTHGFRSLLCHLTAVHDFGFIALPLWACFLIHQMNFVLLYRTFEIIELDIDCQALRTIHNYCCFHQCQQVILFFVIVMTFITFTTIKVFIPMSLVFRQLLLKPFFFS